MRNEMYLWAIRSTHTRKWHLRKGRGYGESMSPGASMSRNCARCVGSLSDIIRISTVNPQSVIIHLFNHGA